MNLKGTRKRKTRKRKNLDKCEKNARSGNEFKSALSVACDKCMGPFSP